MKRSHSVLLSVAALLPALLALPACGAPTHVPRATVAAPAAPSAPAPTGGATANPGGPTGATVTKTVPATADAMAGAHPENPAEFTIDDPTAQPGAVYFQSPTRRISCKMSSTDVGCAVRGSDVIPPGADCTSSGLPVDHMTKGYSWRPGEPMRPSCFPKPEYNVSSTQKVLPYGSSVTAADATCSSSADGVTCRRGDHGFFVSAQRFDQW